MEIPSDTELALLPKLKLQIKDLNLSEEFLEDKNLVRWLRARNHNLELAEKRIRKSNEWYIKNDIDNLMDSYGPKLAKEFPMYISGFDGTGCPVVVMQLGLWDVHKAISSGSKLEFTRHALQMIHTVWLTIKKQSESRGYMTQFVGIFDFKGFGFRQVTSYDVLERYLYIAKIFEANYPETLKKGYIINASLAFQILWKAIRPLMDDKTHSKIKFMKSDCQSWREEISQIVPLDQFPKLYGGSAQDDHSKVTVNGDGIVIIP